MNYYWEVSQEQGMLAALLDLRFKELGFAFNSLRLRSQKQLKNAYQDMRILTGENQEVELQPVSLNSLLANVTHVDEIANYLALPKKVFGHPTTSTLNERLFSKASNVMTIKRIQLASNMLENLVFCKKNWHLVGGIFL